MSAFMDRVGNTIPGVVLRCFSWNLFSPLVRGHGHVTDRLAGKHARGASRCPCACVGDILISAFMERVGNTIPGVVLRCFSWNLFSPLVRGLQSIRTCP